MEPTPDHGRGGSPPSVAETVRSYDESSRAYADWSVSYARFPGLREELLAFDSRVAPGLFVLDAGCGAGRDARELAANGRSVVALDMSEGMLREWRSPTVSAGSIYRVCGDLACPPFQQGSLGGVWACASLLHQHPDTMQSALANLVALLAPHGVFAASMRRTGSTGQFVSGAIAGPRWFTVVTPEEFASRCESAGLASVEWRDTANGWFIAWGRAPSRRGPS